MTTELDPVQKLLVFLEVREKEMSKQLDRIEKRLDKIEARFSQKASTK